MHRRAAGLHRPRQFHRTDRDAPCTHKQRACTDRVNSIAPTAKPTCTDKQRACTDRAARLHRQAASLHRPRRLLAPTSNGLAPSAPPACTDEQRACTTASIPSHRPRRLLAPTNSELAPTAKSPCTDKQRACTDRVSGIAPAASVGLHRPASVGLHQQRQRACTDRAARLHRRVAGLHRPRSLLAPTSSEPAPTQLNA
jgi:hypothetical protein